MTVGISKWLEMSNEERADYLRLEEEAHVRRLRSLTMEESLRRGFELMDMGRHFEHPPHSLPLAPSLLIG